MLMSESLEIGEMFRAAMADRYGEAELPTRFRAFDTICSATQERQDAVVALLDEQPLDLAMVDRRLQQQQHLQSGADLRRARRRRFTSPSPDCLVSADEIRHRPIGAPSTADVRRGDRPELAAARARQRRA